MEAEQRRTPLLPAALWCSLALVTAALLYGRALADHVRSAADTSLVNDDVRQHIFPYFRYSGDGPFPRDLLGDYHLACHPLGYRALFALFGASGTAVFASRVIPYVLLVLTVVLLAWAAYRVAGPPAAVAVALLALGNELLLDRLVGGLPRAFSAPLTALLIAGIVEGKPRVVCLAVWLGAAFHPVTSVVAGAALVCWFFLVPARDRGDIVGLWSSRRRATFTIIAGVGALVLVTPVMVATRPYGSVITPAAYDEFPEAGPGGRWGPDGRAPYPAAPDAIFDVVSQTMAADGEPIVPEVHTWLRSAPHRLTAVAEGVGLVIVLGWGTLLRKTRWSRRALCVLLAAVVSHAVALLHPPLFYLPQRYISTVIPVFLLFFCAVAGAGFGGTIRRHPGREIKNMAVMPIVVVLTICFGTRISARVGYSHRIDVGSRLFAFVGSLPKDSLIAGWPDGLMDDIPYVTRRRALLTRETHQPFHRVYAEQTRARMVALIDAYHALDDLSMKRLRDEFGVTHVVVQPSLLQSGLQYFKPFQSMITRAEWRARGQRRFIQQPPPAAVVFNDGEHIIMDLRRL